VNDWNSLLATQVEVEMAPTIFRHTPSPRPVVAMPLTIS
jgi:hypothetical protein